MIGIPCIFKVLTGYDCAFCGAQRSIVALVHGDIKTAFLYNPYLYMMLPYIIMVLLCGANVIPEDSKLGKILLNKYIIIVAAIICVAWTIYRNIWYTMPE